MLRLFLQAMADAASPAYILGTRKTAPGLRLVDKWASLNLLFSSGGISNALRAVDQFLERENLHAFLSLCVSGCVLELISETLIDMLAMCFPKVETRPDTRGSKGGNAVLCISNKDFIDRIMLDNMVVPLANGDVDVSMLKEAVDLISGKFETEVFHGFIM
ncbi:hypothetical protein CCACVL1_20126 [Corchorus capsularis]|uniref:Uncharacterized protein n=1 Tax=Corchorus capsularis TaxID=210143 RepID=A0A1R3HCI8_COCAP|nr:hypothetical protein CCACVL1_20126 [Corchorus capsularis]